MKFKICNPDANTFADKVKIKPLGFKENILLAKVFNIKDTKEMTELLVAKDLTSEICPS